MEKVSIVIPNYNGKELIKDNIPALFNAVKRCKINSEIIVVDDASTDDTVSFLKKEYPEVRVIVNKENRGFSYSCNRGVKEAEGDIVYLLNSDCKVKEDFLGYILPHFEDKNVFAVGSDESNSSFYPDVRFKYGLLYYKYKRIKGERPLEVFFISGGHSAFDRNKFLKLKGFDETLSPFYGEDIDLCWRAKKMGWRIILEPKSKVYHHRQSTISKYYTVFIRKKILWRNRFLLMWKNFSRKQLLIHFLFLPVLILLSPFKDIYFLPGFLSAVYKVIYEE